MDNDALNSVDQFERAISAALERLRGLAPAAIQDRIGRGDPRRRCRIFRPHDADQDIERGPGVAARQRADFGKRLRHLGTPADHGCKLQFDHLAEGANGATFRSHRFATERQIRPTFKLPLLWQGAKFP